MAKAKVEVLANNIMLEEMQYKGDVVEVDQKIVDIINEQDEGYGSPRIKVIPKRTRKKAAPKKDVE